MQANDLVRTLGRRTWIVAVVALLAAAVGFAVAMRQASDTQVTAVLLTHPETSQFGSSVGYVTAFQAALDTDAVLDSVASKTGVSTTDLRRGLQAQPTASNSLSFDVTYRGSQDADTVAQVPVAAAEAVIATLYQPQLETAVQEQDALQSAADDTQAKVQAMLSSSGLSPAVQYASVTNVINQLRVTKLQNQASSLPQYSSSELQAAIDAALHKAQRLAGKVDRYTRLTGELDRREADLQQASSDVARLQRLAAPESISSGIVAGSTVSVSRISSAVQAAVAAGLVALVFGLLLLSALASRKRRTADIRDDGAFARPGLSTGK